jgi:hypothetical protein
MSNGFGQGVGQLSYFSECKILTRLGVGGFSQAESSLAEAQRLINEEAQGKPNCAHL